MGCVLNGNVYNLVLSIAVQEGQNFSKSNKISTITIGGQRIHDWKMFSWHFSLILHVEVGCDVAKGSQLGAQPAGHLVLAGNGGPCSECAPALNRHLWSAFSVQAWCAPALGLPVLLKSRKWKPNASILLSKVLSPFLTPKKSNQIFHPSWKTFSHSTSHCGRFHLPGYTPHISNQSWGWSLELHSSWTNSEHLPSLSMWDRKKLGAGSTDTIFKFWQSQDCNWGVFCCLGSHHQKAAGCWDVWWAGCWDVWWRFEGQQGRVGSFHGHRAQEQERLANFTPSSTSGHGDPSKARAPRPVGGWAHWCGW